MVASTLETFMERLAAPSSASDGLADHNELSVRRQVAFDRAQKHSRMVVIMRRLFPVLAVVCVGMYFFSGKFTFQFKDMKASVERIELSKDELKMINPRLEGHDEKSGSYLVIADSATQKSGSPDIIELDQVDGKLVHPKNGTITLKSNYGKFDTKSEILWLSGDILIVGTNGMRARLEDAKIIFKEQLISSDNPVFVEMNGSTIRAHRLFIEGTKKIMTFSDRVNVRLIKNPKKSMVRNPQKSLVSEAKK